MCRDSMPDCTVVTVPNGHIVMWEAFDESTATLAGRSSS